MSSHPISPQRSRVRRSTKSCIERARARGVKDPRQFCKVKRN